MPVILSSKMSINSIEAEYSDISNRNAWPLVFQKIARECQAYPYTCIEAKKPQNKPLNRYRDVNPYDHSRIVLQRCQKDYINANLVTMEGANRKYILTQGPLKFTAGHFWLMVWEQKSKAVLMLNKIIEKNEIKCHMYWPEGLGKDHKITFSDVNLSVEQISSEDFNYYTTRIFRVTDLDSGDSQEVIQFHYTTWPDFGVPTSPVAFLNFLNKVKESGALEADVGPAIVHCSAGIGRSGTFCLVDSCLVMIEKEGFDNINIQNVLMEMRKCRMGLIQTPDQLKFSYKAIIEGVKRLDPSWKDSSAIEESLYSSEEEEAPPLPPPRGESLSGKPPGRPLPAIPASVSCGNLDYPDSSSASSEDEHPPTPPPRQSPPALASEQDVPSNDSGASSNADGNSVRKRRNREMKDRISTIKKRAKDAERWHAIKRFKSKDSSQNDTSQED